MILPDGQPLRFDMGLEFRWDGNVPENLYPPNTMSDPNNKVSININTADETMLIGHLQAIIDYFVGKGPALTKAQRRMPSIADERAGMLDVLPTEMNAHPQIRPQWINMGEVTKDVDALRSTKRVIAKAAEALTRLEDFDKLLGNDLLLNFSAHFGASREAARRNQPGAQDSYDRMAPYFPGGGGGGGTTPPPTP
jgi:hypothetical protein